MQAPSRQRHVFYGVTSLESLRGLLQDLPAFAEAEVLRLRPDARWERVADGPTAPHVWFWQDSPQALVACAGRLLRHFLLPLCRDDSPFCLAVPLQADRLAPASLDLDSMDALDIEDIGTLLVEAAHLPALTAVGGGRYDPSGSAAYLLGLDAAQRAAAMHGRGAARVLAPAGAGKTKTMIAHVAHLIATGARPSQILVLAFNTEAALQLEERLAALEVPCTRIIPPQGAAGRARPSAAPVSVQGVHCATFNAFGFRYQRDVIGSVPAVGGGGGMQERALRAALASAKAEYAPSIHAPSAREAPDPFHADLSDRVWHTGHILTALRSDLTAASPRDKAILAAYERHQHAAGVQTFDDQVYAALVHLLADPAARHHIQSAYRHVLVDEFQDVNEAQLALLDVLSRPWRNLYVVGDDDQLIYGWRNARPRSIVDFGAHRPRLHEPSTYVLETNYRGSCDVVRYADRLVRHNQVRVPKDVRPRSGADRGACCLCGTPDWPARARVVAAFLAAERARLECAWHQLAVLCRYRAQLQAVAPHLLGLGIPVPAMPAAELACSPAAQAVRRRLQRVVTPAPGATRSERSLGDWVRNQRPSAVEALDEAIAILHLGGAPRAAGGEAGGVQEVLDAARLLAWDHADLPSFLDHWSRLAERAAADTPAQQADTVTMATIHATKGREYDSVAIVDFAPPVTKASPEEVEEERRVLYVAITRARHSALLTADLSRPLHPFMVQLSVADTRPRRLRAEKREQAGKLAGLGLHGAPWESPPPAWLSRLGELTPAQGEQLAEAFRVHGLLTEARLARPRAGILAGLCARLGWAPEPPPGAGPG